MFASRFRMLVMNTSTGMTTTMTPSSPMTPEKAQQLANQQNKNQQAQQAANNQQMQQVMQQQQQQQVMQQQAMQQYQIQQGQQPQQIQSKPMMSKFRSFKISVINPNFDMESH